MEKDRWSAIREQAEHSSKRFISWLRFAGPMDKEQAGRIGFIRGYFAGATQFNRRVAACSCGQSNEPSGCSVCYRGPVFDLKAASAAGASQ